MNTKSKTAPLLLGVSLVAAGLLSGCGGGGGGEVADPADPGGDDGGVDAPGETRGLVWGTGTWGESTFEEPAP